VNDCKPLGGGGARAGGVARGAGGGGGGGGGLGTPGSRAGLPGRSVLVEPIQPKLKLPGIERLKLKCDEPLSNFAFNFRLRRYTLVGKMQGEWAAAAEAAAYSHGDAEVGRYRLTLANPC